MLGLCLFDLARRSNRTQQFNRMQRLPAKLLRAVNGQNVLRAFASDVHFGVHGTGLAELIDQSLVSIDR